MFKEEEKVKKANKRERKQVEAKWDAQRTLRREQARKLSQQARREKQQARKEKQRARQRRKRARQAQKKKEMQLRPEKPARAELGGHQRKLVDQEVKKILMRAPLNMMSDSPKSNGEEKAGKINVSNLGWKAGMRTVASETAPARQCKKLPTSQFLKLLKKAMRLATNEVNSNVTDTNLDSPEMEEAASSSPARQETVLPPDNSDQTELTSPEEDLINFEQDLLHSETPEDRVPNDHGVVLEGIGPDLCADMPDLSKMAKEGSKYIVGLVPDCGGGKAVSPRENSNSEKQEVMLQLPSQEKKAKFRRRRRETLARRKGGDNMSELVDSSEEDEDTDTRSKAKISKQLSLNVPCLTDISDDEEKSTDRRKVKARREAGDSRAVLTESSEDEEENERKGKPKVLKGLGSIIPSLTDSSEGEEETERGSKVKVLKELMDSCNEEPMNGLEAKIYTGDFRGGGAGGSNYYVWLQMAQRIMVGVRNAQLPLTLPLNDITEGDGNCYFRAVCSQCKRPEVAAPDHIRRLDHRAMRKNICNFMLKSQLPVVLNLRERWFQFDLGDYNPYWKNMAQSSGEIWAEFPVLHATAWYLERHIHVVSEKSTVSDRFIPFCGNQDGSDKPCTGAALWLGHLTGLHYQTLMLDKTEVMPPPPKMQTIEDTLRSREQATNQGGDQQKSQPGTSRNSSKVKVSLIHCLSNSST